MSKPGRVITFKSSRMEIDINQKLILQISKMSDNFLENMNNGVKNSRISQNNNKGIQKSSTDPNLLPKYIGTSGQSKIFNEIYKRHVQEGLKQEIQRENGIKNEESDEEVCSIDEIQEIIDCSPSEPINTSWSINFAQNDDNIGKVRTSVSLQQSEILQPKSTSPELKINKEKVLSSLEESNSALTVDNETSLLTNGFYTDLGHLTSEEQSFDEIYKTSSSNTEPDPSVWGELNSTMERKIITWQDHAESTGEKVENIHKREECMEDSEILRTSSESLRTYCSISKLAKNKSRKTLLREDVLTYPSNDVFSVVNTTKIDTSENLKVKNPKIGRIPLLNENFEPMRNRNPEEIFSANSSKTKPIYPINKSSESCKTLKMQNHDSEDFLFAKDLKPEDIRPAQTYNENQESTKSTSKLLKDSFIHEIPKSDFQREQHEKLSPYFHKAQESTENQTHAGFDRSMNRTDDENFQDLSQKLSDPQILYLKLKNLMTNNKESLLGKQMNEAAPKDKSEGFRNNSQQIDSINNYPVKIQKFIVNKKPEPKKESKRISNNFNDLIESKPQSPPQLPLENHQVKVFNIQNDELREEPVDLNDCLTVVSLKQTNQNAMESPQNDIKSLPNEVTVPCNTSTTAIFHPTPNLETSEIFTSSNDLTEPEISEEKLVPIVVETEKSPEMFVQSENSNLPESQPPRVIEPVNIQQNIVLEDKEVNDDVHFVDGAEILRVNYSETQRRGVFNLYEPYHEVFNKLYDQYHIEECTSLRVCGGANIIGKMNYRDVKTENLWTFNWLQVTGSFLNVYGTEHTFLRKHETDFLSPTINERFHLRIEKINLKNSKICLKVIDSSCTFQNTFKMLTCDRNTVSLDITQKHVTGLKKNGDGYEIELVHRFNSDLVDGISRVKYQMDNLLLILEEKIDDPETEDRVIYFSCESETGFLNWLTVLFMRIHGLRSF